ncbi:FKBP C domain containing protein [Trichuris trichiura]|uniref:peptidylprolyl isomerase n=1 Tax=Trichuris trichiura TaxID=36087 RepID=A0A077YZE2_TRITR|nr:FKBP C domain containing protein [Trichuris trichiura]
MLTGHLALLIFCALTLADVKIGIKRKATTCDTKSKNGDILHVRYKGMLSDGTEFDSTQARDEPFAFSLGSGQVISGWEKGLQGMCESEIRRLIIPPELAYGSSGVPPVIPLYIAADSTLTFEIELLKIERPDRDL